MSPQQQVSFNTEVMRANAATVRSKQSGIEKAVADTGTTTQALSGSTFDAEIAETAKATVRAFQAALTSTTTKMTAIHGSLGRTCELVETSAEVFDTNDLTQARSVDRT